ncbi:hypothetical protein EDC04DRAFT_3086919 [Pisolithus marmoratus]|nr:hypothetical protein EDC04DRAFT_3086919 [Pisolithus marmoratus]
MIAVELLFMRTGNYDSKLFWGQAMLGCFWFIHIFPEAASPVAAFTRPKIDFTMRMGKPLPDRNISTVRCTDWSAGRFKVAVRDVRCVLCWFHLTVRDDVFGDK